MKLPKLKFAKIKLTRKQAIILGIVALAAALAFIKFFNKPQTSPGKVVTHSTDAPSEVKPGKEYKWVGDASDPKKIIIPKIGVDGFVEKVGIDQNNQVAVPTNLFLVGWFVKTASPGQPGLSVIDGHVSGRKNDGIFKDLEKLNVGDKYTVELGNGKKLTYQVISKKSAPVKDSVAVIFSQDPRVKSQLNLVTCSGNYDAKLHQYSERLTVAAKLV